MLYNAVVKGHDKQITSDLPLTKLSKAKNRGLFHPSSRSSLWEESAELVFTKENADTIQEYLRQGSSFRP